MRFHPGDENRAWKAAPTTRTTLKALKLTRMRLRGNDGWIARQRIEKYF
jgi:hypothetical protein